MGLSLFTSQELSHVNWGLGGGEEITCNSSENKGSDPNSLTASGSLYVSVSGARMTSVYIELLTVTGPNSILIHPHVKTELIHQNTARSTLLTVGQTKSDSGKQCSCTHPMSIFHPTHSE